MNFVQLAAGGALIAVVLADAVRTTLSVGTGSGPMTGLVTKLLWQAALFLHRHRTSHRMLGTLGVSLLLGTVGLWVVLLIAGWTIVFTTTEAAVVTTSGGAPADLSGRIWFTSYTVFSLGNGEYRPEGDGWQLVAAAATATGISLVTLGVSYLIPVVGAVVERRRLALHITALGRTPADIAAFAAEHPDAFVQHAVQLVQEIGMMAQQHLAYPVLHYFHSTGPASSAAVAVTILDEAMTILELGVDDLPGAVAGGVVPLQESIRQLLHTLEGAFISSVDRSPPAPALERATPFPLPFVDQATYSARVAERDEHRRLLFGMLRDDGWEQAARGQPLALDTVR